MFLQSAIRVAVIRYPAQPFRRFTIQDHNRACIHSNNSVSYECICYSKNFSSLLSDPTSLYNFLSDPTPEDLFLLLPFLDCFPLGIFGLEIS